SKGLIYEGRDGLNPVKTKIAEITNRSRLKGATEEALCGADVFIGLSGGTVHESCIATMSDNAIVSALSNPTPEVHADVALRHATLVSTGRSDYPTHINSVLPFPGSFRGALDVRPSAITEGMRLAAANALADSVGDDLRPDYVIPGPFDDRVAPAAA